MPSIRFGLAPSDQERLEPLQSRQIVGRLELPNQDVEVYSLEGRRSSNANVRRWRAGHLKDIRQDLQHC